MLKKKAVLEWLESEMSINKGHPDDIDIHWTLNRVSKKIQSGAFDADNAEIQRLRAALMDTSLLIEDMAVSRIDDFYRLRDNARAMVAMIHSDLSTTTEPINAEKVERVREEIRGLLQQWDFRGIAEQLDSGYEKSVVIELVELCEKLTGAKSPRINAPEGDGNDA